MTHREREKDKERERERERERQREKERERKMICTAKVMICNIINVELSSVEL